MNSQKNCSNNSVSPSTTCGCETNITLNITPTTGGGFSLRVDSQTSVDSLKKIMSKKLKLHKEKICLLYREKQLREGTLYENGLVDGSRLTLLPTVETGLLTQRPELSVMQALESLNDSQVNDFLSGKAPLNLTMRLGDHMMLIQLQLSTVSATGSTISSSNRPRAQRSSSTRESNRQVLISSLTNALSLTAEEAKGVNNDQAEAEQKVESLRGAGVTGTAFGDPISAGLTSCLCHNLTPPTCSCTTPNSPAPGQLNQPTQQAPPTRNNTHLDSRALAQASRNLTQTLRQLSTEVLSSREIEQRSQGAIIESMQHHGRGVYSGIFSGTLNPALQDSRGRPRRDISTIVHILNDLLCAAPSVARANEDATNVPPKPPTSHDSPSNCAYGECRGHDVPAKAHDYNLSKVTAQDSYNCSEAMPLPTHSSPLKVPTRNEYKVPDLSKVPTGQEYCGCYGTECDPSVVQNTRTRDKIEHLRLVMGERRERRRLRKQKHQPYTIPTAAEASDTVSA